MDMIRVGIDRAKNVFQVHGVAERECPARGVCDRSCEVPNAYVLWHSLGKSTARALRRAR